MTYVPCKEPLSAGQTQMKMIQPETPLLNYMDILVEITLNFIQAEQGKE